MASPEPTGSTAASLGAHARSTEGRSWDNVGGGQLREVSVHRGVARGHPQVGRLPDKWCLRQRDRSEETLADIGAGGTHAPCAHFRTTALAMDRAPPPDNPRNDLKANRQIVPKARGPHGLRWCPARVNRYRPPTWTGVDSSCAGSGQLAEIPGCHQTWNL